MLCIVKGKYRWATKDTDFFPKLKAILLNLLKSIFNKDKFSKDIQIEAKVDNIILNKVSSISPWKWNKEIVKKL